MSREVYTVRWNRNARRWHCPQLGLTNVERENKVAFVYRLAVKLHRRWKFAHVLCQLKVFGKNGRIQSERTYGKDPKRYPG